MAVDVGIVLGSASDWPQVEPAAVLLRDWGITCEVVVASAHRARRWYSFHFVSNRLLT